MSHIGNLAVHSVNRWDAAAASLVTGDKVATYGATDERVNPPDQAQYDINKGPCVDALKTGEIQYFDGTSVEPSWRQFAESAANCGIYSTLSFPLRLNGQTMGALSLYSRERDAIRPGHREEGSSFGAHAALMTSNIQIDLSRLAGAP